MSTNAAISDPAAEVAKFLEQRARDRHEALSSPDFDPKSPLGQHIWSEVAPDYVASLENIAEGLNWDEASSTLIRNQRELGSEYKIRDIWVEVDLPLGLATVYVNMDVSGWMGAGHVEFEVLGTQLWRLSNDGKWKLHRYRTFRGGKVGGGG